MENKYTTKYLKAIRAAKNTKELTIIINKIYEDGFEDGVNDQENN